MKLNTVNEIFRRTSLIVDLDNEIREVEDEYLETWLMDGCPDSSTIGEIADYVAEDETFEDWLQLGRELLTMREQDCE